MFQLSIGLVLAFLTFSHALTPRTNFTTQGRCLMYSSTTSPQPQVFHIRGFSYSNSRIGEGPSVDSTTDGFDAISRPNICQQDFTAMRAFNVNSIKTYAFNQYAPNITSLHKQCLDIAWNNGVKPIFVILSVWIPSLPFASPSDRDAMGVRYTNMVLETADHPAVMGYSIGSEIGGDPNNNPSYWADFNAVIAAARRGLQGRRKIITSGTYQADCTSCSPVVPVIGHIINGEKYGADVDVWGVDIYSPDPDEPTLRQHVYQATTKPLMLPEFGVATQPPSDPNAQAQVLLRQVYDLERFSYNESTMNLNQGNDTSKYDPNGPIYAGGLIFEWIDEYWKGTLGLCIPDPNSAQTWYGANAVQQQSGCTCPSSFQGSCALDTRVPRPILSNPNMLLAAWNQYVPPKC
eukprot:PhF_6_TR26261/c0_g1_i1/m.37577